MFVIIDKRAPLEVKINLAKYTKEVFKFSSEGITYNSISGHPDIFIFQDDKTLLIAPNSPQTLIDLLDKKEVQYSFGNLPVGKSLDDSVLYNCLSTDQYFFCKPNKPDATIQTNCMGKKRIALPQAYTRCSMFAIENKIITSDQGILKVLEKNAIESFYFDPSEIRIQDHQYGFIGGTMGATEDKVFFLGNILKHKDGKSLEKFITALGKEVICLGNDYLYDGGGLFFVS